MNLIIGLIIISLALVINGKTVIYFEYIGNCREHNKFEKFMYHENASWGMVTPEVSEYNATFMVLKNIHNLNAKIEAAKCDTLDGHKCETFLTVPFRDFCKTLGDKKQFYSTFMESSTPPMNCPPKKGQYQLRHVTVPGDFVEHVVDFRTLPPSFKLLIHLYDNSEVGCLENIARVINVKSRKRKPHTKNYHSN